MKIHLGVIDMPEPEGGTTYSVATILEEKYGLFSNFVDFGLLDLEDILTDSLNDALATMMAGGPKDANPFSDAMADIERIFKQEYLAQQGVERIGIPGTPTKAALEGKSIRFKRRKGPRRPSFIDSGTLQNSFKAWTE